MPQGRDGGRHRSRRAGGRKHDMEPNMVVHGHRRHSSGREGLALRPFRLIFTVLYVDRRDGWERSWGDLCSRLQHAIRLIQGCGGIVGCLGGG